MGQVYCVLLAVDDTDSTEGGCTTHLALQVLAALDGVELRGLPRLVRLNPNVPWKTRGNGAVVLPLGHAEGPRVQVGHWNDAPVYAFPDSPPTTADNILATARKVILEGAAEGAEPGVALFAEPPPALVYWNTVRGLVRVEEARGLARALPDVEWDALGDGRGLVGCLGAAAWPGPPASFELIAYRRPDAWGTNRHVEPSALAGLDDSGATFHTADPVSGRMACVPNTPCPVLAGLRGQEPDRLWREGLPALKAATAEPLDGWMIFTSNQASGDHVMPIKDLGDAHPFSTVRMDATVVGLPETRQGGHVFVDCEDGAKRTFHVVAFEPTKDLREVVRLLRPGDRLTLVGAWEEGTVRLEKLGVLRLTRTWQKTANPVCCGKSMKSRGDGAGYRCSRCGETATEEDADYEEENRRLMVGWHEVPVSARRHLHQPLGWKPLPEGASD